MPNTLVSKEHETELKQLSDAVAQKRLTPAAAENIRAWLTQPRYRDYAPEVIEHIRAGKWQQLDDVFWTVIPFGTGGRRGKMYPIGSNAINDRTIGESAQGLADYVKQAAGGKGLACAIAYDTRHRSRHFAELCAEILAANGFKIWFLDGYRSTPELSFALRFKHCSCGLMVTASHNPPSDNAVKAYWSTGGQLLPPHDKGVIDRVMSVEEIARVPFEQALADGRIEYCQQEVDAEYLRNVRLQSLPGPRQLKIVYSPMHGVGASSVMPALQAAGFNQVELFGPHADPDGDFPNIPEHVANPENPATFDSLIQRAKQIGADLVLSTDPDADRLGCAAPRKMGGGGWQVFTGNQIGALLAEHVLEGRKYAGNLSARHYVVKTLVTTEMIRRIADSYGVTTHGDLQVGFKWIGGLMDEVGPDLFLLGCEESHGFLAGQYARDKDAAVAALMLAEFAARAKAAGQTLHEKLDALFWQHGCHAERTVSKTMPGSEGMARMRKLMAGFRQTPPKTIGGMKVRQTRDYLERVAIGSGGRQPLEGPKGDTLIFDLAAEGNYVAVRPSGTEPKVKFYLFAYEPPELLGDLEETKQQLSDRLDSLQAGLFQLAEAVT
ncbi:MAG TPA: phospho-sugar mutase [Pirellulales bacterium]|jgi:phosphoglucomutase/phosphomannomutase|nr:phospho-sugar mutase [Pirellulales bacterium]